MTDLHQSSFFNELLLPMTADRPAVIFDLDGTLLDTLQDIAMSANRVLEDQSLPVHPVARYRDFIGNGVGVLFEKALGDANQPTLLSECITTFETVYAQFWNRKSRPYPGIVELLEALNGLQIPCAVLSNKPHEFTVRCCEHFFQPTAFECVYGQRDRIPRKPDPTVALEIIQELGVTQDRVHYVGDTVVDMQTAVAAGFRPVAVDWGFRPASELAAAGASRVLTHPLELLNDF